MSMLCVRARRQKLFVKRLAFELTKPDEPLAYYNLGRLLEEKRQDAVGAEEAYRASIEADPVASKAELRLGDMGTA